MSYLAEYVKSCSILYHAIWYFFQMLLLKSMLMFIQVFLRRSTTVEIRPQRERDFNLTPGVWSMHFCILPAYLSLTKLIISDDYRDLATANMLVICYNWESTLTNNFTAPQGVCTKVLAIGRTVYAFSIMYIAKGTAYALRNVSLFFGLTYHVLNQFMKRCP